MRGVSPSRRSPHRACAPHFHTSCAVSLSSPARGLSFPPATRFEHADVCKPREDGGVLSGKGVTEVTSSVYRDGTDVPHHLAFQFPMARVDVVHSSADRHVL